MSRILAKIRRQSAVEAVFYRKCTLTLSSSSSLDVPSEKHIDGPFPAAYDPKSVESGWYAWWVSQGLFNPSVSNEPNHDHMHGGPVKSKFSMVLPPPNVTGDLHVGHALAVTIQDVLQRWQRSCGSSCHWVPGFDHAGIATQVVVEKKLAAAASTMMQADIRHRMGRRAFVREVFKWSGAKRPAIRRQLERLGASLDWNSEVFTMDEGVYSKAVTEAFVRLHEAGLILRRRTLVNWCCHLRSTISDMEVDHVVVGRGRTASSATSISSYKDPSFDSPITGKLYRFAYKLLADQNAGRQEDDEEIVVATTRPETMLGDVAIAVNPRDSRYVRFVGRKVIHPFDGRLLPVIRDDLVDPAFGTGALKVTPGHSHEDFALAKRHLADNGGEAVHALPLLNVFDEKGHISKSDVPQFDGLNRFAARKAIVQQLDRLGLFRGEEDHEITLPICSRSGGVVEPLLKSQWFLETSQLIGEISKDLDDGNLVILPEHARKDVRHWLSISKDSEWCLSRQLWWGHQIPAYRITSTSAAGDHDDNSSWIVARSAEEAAEKCTVSNVSPKELIQDEDVLDTWFSSALFPFAVHGWPEDTDNLRTRYPLSLMETGRDILFFWVIRMLMLGKKMTGQLPFRKVLAHGLVCDAYGRKMSKSLGNVVDPTHVIAGVSLDGLRERVDDHRRDGYISAEEVGKAKAGLVRNFPQGIPECGADALRFALCSQDIQDQTVSVDVKFVNSCRLFCNKIWQASRFYLVSKDKMAAATTSNVPDLLKTRPNMSSLDLWILSQLAKMVVDCDQHLNSYDLHLATWALKKFWYFKLCDVYVEAVKPVFMVSTSRPPDLDNSLNAGMGFKPGSEAEASLSVLRTCIRTGLVALSPFMPFLAEELYQRLKLMPEDQGRSVCEASYPSPDEWKQWRDPQLDDAFDLVEDVVSEVRSFRQLFNVPGQAKPRVDLKILKQDWNNCDRWNETKPFMETLGRCVVNFNDGDHPTDAGMCLRRTPQYELSVELGAPNGNHALVDVAKSIANLEQRAKKLSKQFAKFKDDHDDFQTNILREKKQTIENHLNYLRTMKI